jgi:hypothetical protein
MTERDKDQFEQAFIDALYDAGWSAPHDAQHRKILDVYERFVRSLGQENERLKADLRRWANEIVELGEMLEAGLADSKDFAEQAEEMHRLRDQLAQASAEVDRLKAERLLSVDREWLGKLVRLAWVKWAKEQTDPKPDWLVPWEELEERYREVDRRIGEFIASQCVTPELLRLEKRLEEAREYYDSAEAWFAELGKIPHADIRVLDRLVQARKQWLAQDSGKAR